MVGVASPYCSDGVDARTEVANGHRRHAQRSSVAVDLIPDLDGTSSQQLTRDFPAPDWDASPWRDRVPYALSGLMALLAGLAFVRMLRHKS